MGRVATKEEINGFLKLFKTRVDKQGHLPLVPRRENLSTLALLGIARSEIKTIVFGLTDLEYESGPTADHDSTEGEIWEFVTECDGRKIYIKLKLSDLTAKCLSFHPAAKYR